MGSIVWPVGSLPPTLSSQVLKVPRQTLLLQWAFQSLTLSCMLLHRNAATATQGKPPPLLSFTSSKQTHSLEDRDGNAKSENSIRSHLLRSSTTVRFLAVALLFGGPLVVLRALISALPPDFSQRWLAFFEEHSQNEPLASCRREKKTTIIYDMHGEVIATIGSTSKVSLPVPRNQNSKASSIPAFLWQAVVACEDRRFFQHHGVDPRGLARAALSLSTNGGGSTITQQLVKNVFLNNERKWTRKLVEMLLALILESRMSKWDILQAYLKKTTPMHLATIYSTVAAGGVYHKPFFILRIEAIGGEILEENKTFEGVRMVEEHAVTELKKVLQVQQCLGQRTRSKCSSWVGQMVASDGHRDAWCAGFTRDIACVVWFGYDDHDCAGRHLHPGSGAPQAAQVWKHFLTSICKDRPTKRTKSWRMHSVKNSSSLLKLRRTHTKFWQKASRLKGGAHDSLVWKNVWDWHEASSVWDEREGMVEWTEKRVERSAKVNALKGLWS